MTEISSFPVPPLLLCLALESPPRIGPLTCEGVKEGVWVTGANSITTGRRVNWTGMQLSLPSTNSWMLQHIGDWGLGLTPVLSEALGMWTGED